MENGFWLLSNRLLIRVKLITVGKRCAQSVKLILWDYEERTFERIFDFHNPDSEKNPNTSINYAANATMGCKLNLVDRSQMFRQVSIFFLFLISKIMKAFHLFFVTKHLQKFHDVSGLLILFSRKQADVWSTRSYD